MSRFEELKIWQDGRVLVLCIYDALRNNKDYGFKDQLQRATVSIMNNIAEGSDSGSDKQFIRFLQIAKASSSEVRSMLYLCGDLQYIDKDKNIELQEKVNNISAGIQSLINYLRVEVKGQRS